MPATAFAADVFSDLFGTARGGDENPRWAAGAAALTPLTRCWYPDDGRSLLLRVVAVGELMGPNMTRRYWAKKTVRVELYDASALDIDFGSDTANYADGFGIMLKAFTWHQMVDDIEGTLGLYGLGRRRQNLLLTWLWKWNPEATRERWHRSQFKP